MPSGVLVPVNFEPFDQGFTHRLVRAPVKSPNGSAAWIPALDRRGKVPKILSSSPQWSFAFPALKEDRPESF